MPIETMEAMASTQIPPHKVNLDLEQAVYAGSDFTFLWLEITRKCNLSCVHCYAESSPSAASGLMTKERWQSVIDQAQQMGVKHVQFIGGEPTIHPDFPDLLVWAAQRGMSIEVYSNLTHIKPPLWSLFKQLDVSLATSFYSIHPEIHDAITQGRSQAKTLRNIQDALDRGLELRVGLIDIMPGQELPETINMLRDLGVRNIKTDRSRGVGRAQPQGAPCDVEQLCGNCGYGKAAIDCDGDVFPCVFSRWLCVGNVLSESLRDVLGGKQMRETQRYLDAQFTARNRRRTAFRQTLDPATEKCDSTPPAPCHPECVPSTECVPCSPHHPTCHPQCTPVNM